MPSAATGTRRRFWPVRLLLPAVVVASLAAAPAAAAAPPAPVTLLHLSATGTVQAVPDLLVAHMTGEAQAAAPADAQRQLDRRMDAAARVAAGSTTVSYRLEGYATDHDPDPAHAATGWTARQTLQLQSADGEALLDLLGRLQAAGLALDDLDWTLSPSRLETAQAAATDLALRALRRRADAAARSLGLKPGTMRNVTLEPDAEGPRPLVRAMAMRAAPQATQTVQAVSQFASAEIELHP